MGRVRTPHWKEACSLYEKRLGRFRNLEVTEVKDAESQAEPERRREIESARLLAALAPQDRLIVLDERGKDLTSPGLAESLEKWDAQGQGHTAFLLGGPYGLSQALRDRADFLWRLSALTLPHELARVLLLEQLYRAECIRCRVPYHH